MSFWDKLKKKTNPPEPTEYQREKSAYEKPQSNDEVLPGDNHRANRPLEDPEALRKLYEDTQVKARLEKEMGRNRSDDMDSFGQMIGKGVGTLGDSLKKVSSGQSLLDDDDDDE